MNDPNIELRWSEDGGKSFTVRDKTFMAEAWMKQQPQVELKVKNYFSHSVYARELHIPAGVTLVGEIHKFENLNILSQGSMLVSVENGVIRVDAPFTVVSPAGTKRIAHTITDCIWTTIHGTDLKDVDLIRNHSFHSSN
jgi:hypothetical protein